jgi:hypothetical protein
MGVTEAGRSEVRSLAPGFATAERGAPGYRRTGGRVFIQGARLVVDFAYETVGARRLEAVQSGRHAGHEEVLRRPFVRGGNHRDQVRWSILNSERRQAKAVWGPRVH